MKKLVTLALKFNAIGNGIVNFDEISQRNKELFKFYNKNAKYAKKVFNTNSEGNLDYKIQISSDAVRSGIFQNNISVPTITHHSHLMCDYYSNIDSILRGWLFTEKNGLGTKRASPITISKLIQSNNAKSHLEVATKSGEMSVKEILINGEEKKSKTKKDNNDEEKGSLSLRKKETIGYIEYEGESFIDVNKLQFMSLDDMLDRLAMNPDYLPVFTEMFKNKYNEDVDAKYYSMFNDGYNLPEYGILFNENIQNMFIKHFLKKLYNFNIKRSNSYARLKDLYYKPIYQEDSITDVLNDHENGWIKINNSNDIDELNFNFKTFYNESSLEYIIKRNEIINELKKNKSKK